MVIFRKIIRKKINHLFSSSAECVPGSVSGTLLIFSSLSLLSCVVTTVELPTVVLVFVLEPGVSSDVVVTFSDGIVLLLYMGKRCLGRGAYTGPGG